MGKITAGAATLFMLTSLGLAYMSSTSTSSLMKNVEIAAPPAAEAPMETAPVELPDLPPAGGEAGPAPSTGAAPNPAQQ